MQINTLVSSIGAKVPLLDVVRDSYRRMNLTGRIIGGDCNPQAIGRYYCDDFLVLPPISADSSFQEIIPAIRQAQVNLIIPTRDGELLFYARHRRRFEQEGIQVMIADSEPVSLSLDKLQFAQTLSSWDIPAIPTTIQPEQLPAGMSGFVVKERFGAGSRHTFLNLTSDEATSVSQKLAAPIFQPFVAGTEYSIDLYIDGDGKPTGALCRERVLVENGESRITRSVHLPEVEMLCLTAATRLGLRGHALIQVIIDQHHQPHLVECNARFGGASPLAHAMGLTSFIWFIGEAFFQTTPQFKRSPTEKTLIRHHHDLVIDQ